MSALRHRFLPFTLTAIVGLGAGATLAFAGPGPATGKARAPAAAAATAHPATAGKARVAKGVIVTHAASKFSQAELAGMRPHYNDLKPRARTNTE